MKTLPNNHHAKRPLLRTRARPLDPAEITDRLGEAILEMTMTNLDWRFIGSTKEADNIGVDYVYRKEHAEIDIQLKSSTINLKARNWHWAIRSEIELNMDFYGEIGNFLFLTGLDEKGHLKNRNSWNEH